MEIHLSYIIEDLPWWQLTLLGTVCAFIVTYLSIPAIVSVSKRLQLFEKTKSRGSHVGSVPTLGGVAIFAGFLMVGGILMPDSLIGHYRFVVAALVILFFIGVRDDLMGMDHRRKLIGQLLVAFIITVLGDLRISSFHGIFLFIEEVPYLVSVPFTVFVYIVIINGFNLIDGIDGLASGIAIVVSLAFGALFIVSGDYDLAFVPLMLTGSLLAFFRFNVFSKKNKIFFGDTGSMTIGLIIAVITIQFLECDQIGKGSFVINSSPALAFGILIVPLFDTVRVFLIRYLRGKSPFSADRLHIHHRLLDMGFSHLTSSLLIMAANLLIIAVILLLRNIEGLDLVVIIFFMAAFLSYIPIYLVDRRKDKADAQNK